MQIRIYENFRVVSYAPCYLAQARGLWAKHGLDVVVSESPDTAETALGVLAGRVDLAWGGPMRVMLHHDRDPHCPLRCFCTVVGPEPFVLLGRIPNPRFRFADLVGQKVGIVSEVPTPWELLQEDLRRAGLDPGDLTQATPRTMGENVERLIAGEIDVAQVMEPHTEHAIEAGAHLWHAAAERGDVAFTSFYTTESFLTEHRDVCRTVGEVIEEALQQMREDPPDVLASALREWFPEIAPERLAGAIDRYRALGIWPQTTALGPTGFTRLKGALLSGGFIGADVPYARAVDDVRQ